MPVNGPKNFLENETAFVEAAKTDDRAFETLYDFYFSKIYNYIYRRTGNREDTEDIVSKTFMKVITHLKEYNYQGFTFGAWLYRIATNNLIDYYRKKARVNEVNIERIKELPEPNSSASTLYAKNETQHLVKQILKKLPKKYQDIIYLKYYAELSNQEIADVLKIKTNNVNVLIFRACKKFSKHYTNYEK